MDVIGIIAEYNPFHSGHKYQIEKIKKLFPNSILIVILSGPFTERGTVSIMNKWNKTAIALENGIDLVVELPFLYATQSADVFSSNALKILNSLNVQKIVFGSECGNISKLESIAREEINNKEFDSLVKEYINKGNNYPTSVSLALKKLGLEKIDSPNDLLGISYIKSIIKNNYNIKPIAIKRTNNYHGGNSGNILSASEIRDKFFKGEDIANYINYDTKLLYKNNDFFNLLKYQIVTNNNLKNILTVDEGIEGRINKVIDEVHSLDELLEKLKNKRFTYNRINRMFIHILTNTLKEEAQKNLDYIRVLGFNDLGRKYLKDIKDKSHLKIITKYKDSDSDILKIERKANYIYSMIVKDNSLIKRELERPIYKKKE